MFGNEYGAKIIIQFIRVKWEEGLFVLRCFAGLDHSLVFYIHTMDSFMKFLDNGLYIPIDRSQFPQHEGFDFVKDRILQDDEQKYPVLDSIESLRCFGNSDNVKGKFDRDMEKTGYVKIEWDCNQPVYHFNTGLHLMETYFTYCDQNKSWKIFQGHFRCPAMTRGMDSRGLENQVITHSRRIET